VSDEAPAEQETERGRYLTVRTGPRSLLIHRATPLCDRCAECGCGEQQPPIDLSPGGIMNLMSRGGIEMPSITEIMGMRKAGRNGG
jgi:hypothetical protein